MAIGQIDNVAILEGSLDIPISGFFQGYFSCEEATFNLGQKVTVKIFEEKFICTITSSEVTEGRCLVNVFGGNANMTNIIHQTSYAQTSLDMIIKDLLIDAKEEVQDLSAVKNVILGSWLRAKEPAKEALSHMLRLLPNNHYLRVNNQGKWEIINPKWTPIDFDAMSLNYLLPNENQAIIQINDTLFAFPGMCFKIRETNKKVERVKYNLANKTVSAELHFLNSDSTQDRISIALNKIVKKAKAIDTSIHYDRVYPGKIVDPKQKTVGLFMDDEKIRNFPNAELRSNVGETLLVSKGTRVLVGWEDADPSKPYCLAGSWKNGTGGLVNFTRKFSGTETFDGPKHIFKGTANAGQALVQVKGDLERVHDIGGGDIPPTITPPAILIGGKDAMFVVQLIVPANLAPLVPLFTAIFGKTYTGLAMAVVSCDLGLPLGYIITPANIIVKNGAMPMPAGTYQITIKTGG